MGDLSTSPATMREAFLATLDWWREAGVEEHVEDAPGSWLRAAEPPAEAQEGAREAAPPPPVPEPARRGALSRFLDGDGEGAGAHPGDPAQWPADLSQFRQWWLESEALDPPGAYPRVAPHGPAGAQAMLIIDQPLAEDRETLLEGPQGVLARNMLRAMGFSGENIYFASALPRHNLRPDWDALGAAGYGALLLHHVGLVAPQRVIACGPRVWSLLGHGMPQQRASLTTIETPFAKVPAFATPDLRTLLRDKAARAQTWHSWLDLTETPR